MFRSKKGVKIVVWILLSVLTASAAFGIFIGFYYLSLKNLDTEGSLFLLLTAWTTAATLSAKSMTSAPGIFPTLPSGRHPSLRYPRLRRPHRRRFQDQPHRNQRRRCRGFGGRRRHCAGGRRRVFRRQHSPAEQRHPSHQPRRSPCQHHLRSGQNAKHRFQPRRRSVSKRFDLCGPKIVLSSINAPSPPT